MDFTLDPDWWPSLDVVDVMGGGLYFSIDWRAKKFPGFQMEWSPHWTKKFPGLKMDWSCIEDINPSFFQSHYVFHLEKALKPN